MNKWAPARRLQSLMSSPLTIRSSSREEVSKATDEIETSILTNPGTWTETYKLLVEKTRPDDSLLWKEIGAATKLTPKAILAAIKEFHVLTFDVEKRRFRFYSPAVRKAAEKIWPPPKPK